MLDRRRQVILDAAGVIAKHGVPPQSIPDFLALVGDSADGIPGIPGWGAKSAGLVLSRYEHLETIPANVAAWDVPIKRREALAKALQSAMADALLYRRLATLVEDVPLDVTPEALLWRGPTDTWRPFCQRIGLEVTPR